MFVINSDRSETENKTIRFPLKLIKEIENAIEKKDVTFSGFVIQACRYALDNMGTETDEKDKNIKSSKSKNKELVFY